MQKVIPMQRRYIEQLHALLNLAKDAIELLGRQLHYLLEPSRAARKFERRDAPSPGARASERPASSQPALEGPDVDAGPASRWTKRSWPLMGSRWPRG